MQDGIGATGYAFDSYLPGSGVKQCQHFGCAIANIFVRLTAGLPFWCPGMACIGNGLEWPGFILRPEAQS
jgi:hypothetical protein